MENLVLTDPIMSPDNKVLESALGKTHSSRYREFEKKASKLNLILEWHYYNDGKSWLCKVLNKKKNLCWLSVWNTGFKLTFYFPVKAIDGFYELEIDNEIKTAARERQPVGKSHPVVLLIKNNKIMNDAFKILEYKMRLK